VGELEPIQRKSAQAAAASLLAMAGRFVLDVVKLPYRAEGPDNQVSGKYFIRTTSDTTVMAHQLLAAMFGRRPHPDLQLGFALASDDEPATVHVYVRNVGRGTSSQPFVKLRFEGGDDYTNVLFSPREYWEDRRSALFSAEGSVGQVAFSLQHTQRIYTGDERLVGTLRRFSLNDLSCMRASTATVRPQESSRSEFNEPS
jgi:hypothetical protein